jgi:hypothetical protein
VLVVCCALVCAGIEASTAAFLTRLSRIENRRASEYKRALAIRPARNQHQASVLVAGNSLLLEGVDFRQLQEGVGPGIELRRFVVENTAYYDWYYGLRRLFRMGSQPDTVVLVLNPSQLTSRVTDGDYGAHFLLDWQDLSQFARDTGADRNRLSGLAFSNMSTFYGARAQLRNGILGKILPDLPILTHHFHAPPAALDIDTMLNIATIRLNHLQELCQEHKADLIFVIPPSLGSSEENAVMRASEAIHVKVLSPIAPGSLAESYYSDGFHLNSRGAEKFTPALAESLRQVLSANYVQSAIKSSAPAFPNPKEQLGDVASVPSVSR